MTKRVIFNLGSAQGKSARQLTITRMYRAGDDSAPAAEVDSAVGAVTTSTQTLPSDTIFQAKLVDTLTGGGTSEAQLINFQTGSLQFPGPKTSHGSSSEFGILSMEDLSSSSSSSGSSSSSSSASVSTSSSSVSSSSESSSSSSASSASSSSSQSVSTSSSASSVSSSSVSSSSASSASSSSSLSSSSVSSSSSNSSSSSSSSSPSSGSSLHP